jgi:hypothetical protein
MGCTATAVGAGGWVASVSVAIASPIYETRKRKSSVIVIHQRIDLNSRTANSGSAWIAETIVDGMTYSARSRNGAPLSLARKLIAAGVEDQPVRVFSDGTAGYMTYPSLAKMAGRTIAESAKRPVRSEKWSEFSPIVGKNRDEGVGDDDLVVSELSLKKHQDVGPLAAMEAE